MREGRAHSDAPSTAIGAATPPASATAIARAETESRLLVPRKKANDPAVTASCQRNTVMFASTRAQEGGGDPA
jgi:hypothetical protein